MPRRRVRAYVDANPEDPIGWELDAQFRAPLSPRLRRSLLRAVEAGHPRAAHLLARVISIRLARACGGGPDLVRSEPLLDLVRRVQALGPEDPSVLVTSAHALGHAGHPVEGLELVARAVDIAEAPASIASPTPTGPAPQGHVVWAELAVMLGRWEVADEHAVAAVAAVEPAGDDEVRRIVRHAYRSLLPWRRHRAALLVGTLLPMLLIPVVGRGEPDGSLLPQVLAHIIFGLMFTWSIAEIAARLVRRVRLPRFRTAVHHRLGRLYVLLN